MVDDKPILPQVHDLQTIVNEIVKGSELMNSSKWLPLLKNYHPLGRIYKQTLRHKRKDYSLEHLQRYLRIKEEARIGDQKDLTKNGGKINIAESKSQVDGEKKGKFDQHLGRNKKCNPSFKRKN